MCYDIIDCVFISMGDFDEGSSPRCGYIYSQVSQNLYRGRVKLLFSAHEFLFSLGNNMPMTNIQGGFLGIIV